MKRRNFILASSGIAGSIFAPTIRAAVPCPPPLIVAGGTTAVSPTCPASASSGTSELAALAASMSAGQWASFSMSGMGLPLLDASNGYSITEFSARGHWDPVHRKIQYWGQGHYANEKLITWDDATNQWSVGTSAGFGGIGHGYYHLALDPATGDLYLRGYNSSSVKKKPYGGSWVNIASHHNTANQVAGALEWLPAANSGAGGLAFCDTLSVETWSPATNAWTLRNGSVSGLGPYHNWAAAAGGVVYCGGGNGSSTMYRLAANGTVSAAPATPTQAGVGGGIVMRHPDGNQLLMFSQGSSGSIHRFDGASWVTHGTHQIGGSTNVWFGVPIPDYSIVLFIAQTTNVSIPAVKVYKV